jgi:hypothetical protein
MLSSFLGSAWNILDVFFSMTVDWSSWLQPRGPGFDSRHYQIFCMAVALERGPLSLVSINEELLERKVAGPV